MKELKELIIQYFKTENKFHSLNEIKKKFNIKGEEQTKIFDKAILALFEDGSLFFDEKKGYKLFTNELGLACGKIEINKSGNGFVHTKDGYTIFINEINLKGALDGDTVIVEAITQGRNNCFEGIINKVIKRNNGNLIYEAVVENNEISLRPYNKNEKIKIKINKNALKNLISGEMILVNVGTDMYNDEYKAEIIKTIGHKDDPNIDIRLIATKYNIPIEFNKEVLEELNNIPKEVNDNDIIDRIDLRNKNFVTIDCDNTKDRDDAVYVEKLNNGNYKLIVSIADVSHYIKRNSKLFDEALNRCTSHYINNSCIPMFPHAISNGICSLNPNVDRLTKSCEIEIDNNGSIINYTIYNSVINSKKAMKYSEVNKVLNQIFLEEYEPFKESLFLMKELNEILIKQKQQRNYLDFDIPDIEIIQDENGKATDFKELKRGFAEEIIENFMIITNVVIAENYSWLPFIFRVHESPDEEKVKNTIELIKSSGINFNKVNKIDEYTIKNILDKIKDIDTNGIFRNYLLKSMKRARYDIINLGHFALQLPIYCHFTSPIRRISDFIIHTLISELDEFDYTEESINKLEKELYLISEQASKMEKIDFDMEKEGIAMAMAEYMENHIGEEYKATISEIYQHGMFVKTDNQISGKISFENMLDDKYKFNYDKKQLVGLKTKKTYKIGDRIVVFVKNANKSTRTINFETGKQKNLKK